MKTFEEFVRDIIPDIDSRYELYKLCQTPEKLIGLKVVAIRAGFSCSEGGTKMTIKSVDEMTFAGNTDIWVHFISNEDTLLSRRALNGWSCKLSELPHSVKPY